MGQHLDLAFHHIRHVDEQVRLDHLTQRIAMRVRLSVIDGHLLQTGARGGSTGKFGMPRAKAAVTASRQALVWSSM